jgi:hypothetical protein
MPLSLAQLQSARRLLLRIVEGEGTRSSALWRALLRIELLLGAHGSKSRSGRSKWLGDGGYARARMILERALPACPAASGLRSDASGMGV